MSYSTSLSIRGIARDPSGFKTAEAGALRRAENVVVRSEGVAETRPGFDLLFERSTGNRVKSIQEFDGTVITVEQDANTLAWSIAGDNTPIATLDSSGSDPLSPPNFDDCETKFAEARGNLYITGERGVVALESGSGPLRWSGVDMIYVTDYDANRTTSGGYVPKRVFGYRWVYVKKDSGGYVRRSPPSEMHVCTQAMGPQVFGTGTRFYFPSQLDAGDQVEFYRTIVTVGFTPRPETYLALTYTLTSGDISAGYFVPPNDVTQDADLGAELYTDSAQGGAIAAKYRPPIASVLSWWQRCMWYGRTRATQRLALTISNLYAAGVASFASNSTGVGPNRAWQFTSASNSVTVTDTTGIVQGMVITDNFLLGPTVAGTYVPANTYVTGISGTTVTMSHNALASGSADIAALPLTPIAGLMAYTTTGTLTSGSSTVTGIPSTTGMRVGMYFTTNASSAGGSTSASAVPAGTKILQILSSSSIKLDNNATSTGSVTFYVGDVITINSADFYAWRMPARSPNSFWQSQPWDTSVNPPRGFHIGMPDDSAQLGPFNYGLTMMNLAIVINYYALTHPTWRVRATAVGDLYDFVALSTGDDGTKSWPGTTPVSIVLEGASEIGDISLDGISVSCTCTTAFSPNMPQDAESTTRPNRVYFSDLDEPESVPLVNFIDIGLLDEPIQALVPLRNALLVFKTDGIWRITGAGPAGWTVEQLETRLKLIRPETVTSMNGVAYAWTDRGFFSIDEGAAQSLSANTIDVELRQAAAAFDGQPLTHGTFVVCWRRRNLVLLGVPDGAQATATARVYVFCITTGAWSEWPVAWGCAGESVNDTLYESRPADGTVELEVRYGVDPRGYDRSYLVGSATSVTGAVIVFGEADVAPWEPAVGDFVSTVIDAVTYWRRIVDAVHGGGSWTLTLDSAVDGSSVEETWRGYEASALILEWAPSGTVPVGGIAREVQVQVDLRDATAALTPKYLIGATSELTGPSTVTSNKALVASVQPIRAQAPRAVARYANLAPYFETSNAQVIRVLGVSTVYEGTSEKTTR